MVCRNFMVSSYLPWHHVTPSDPHSSHQCNAEITSFFSTSMQTSTGKPWETLRIFWNSPWFPAPSRNGSEKMAFQQFVSHEKTQWLDPEPRSEPQGRLVAIEPRVKVTQQLTASNHSPRIWWSNPVPSQKRSIASRSRGDDFTALNLNLPKCFSAETLPCWRFKVTTIGLLCLHHAKHHRFRRRFTQLVLGIKPCWSWRWAKHAAHPQRLSIADFCWHPTAPAPQQCRAMLQPSGAATQLKHVQLSTRDVVQIPKESYTVHVCYFPWHCSSRNCTRVVSSTSRAV